MYTIFLKATDTNTHMGNCTQRRILAFNGWQLSRIIRLFHCFCSWNRKIWQADKNWAQAGPLNAPAIHMCLSTLLVKLSTPEFLISLRSFPYNINHNHTKHDLPKSEYQEINLVQSHKTILSNEIRNLGCALSIDVAIRLGAGHARNWGSFPGSIQIGSEAQPAS